MSSSSSSSSPPPISLLKPQEWNPVVVTLVGFVCTIFLVFSYYKIFRRHCCWFRAVTISRSSGFQRRMINEANPDDPWLQFESRGLDSFVMHSIPITQFRKKNEEEDQLEKAGGNTDCAVCLGEFEEGEWVKSLPNCCHVFHVACIDTWFQIHSSCPLCRSYVYDLPTHNDYSVSMHTLFETLRREDQNSAEVSARNEALRSQILQNASLRLDTDNQR